MRNKFSNTISGGLLALFMLATLGIPVTQHICLATGHADAALFADEDFHGCCPVDKGCTENDMADCCDQDQEFLQLDIDTKSERMAIWKSNVPSITLHALPTAIVLANNYTIVDAYRYNLPPPEQGTDLVILLANFRC